MAEIIESIYEHEPGNTGDMVGYEATHQWHVDRVETTNGIELFIEGAEFPQKGYPAREAIQAVNVLKRIIKMLMIPQMVFVNKNKFLYSFNATCDKIIGQYRLQPKFMCPFAKELETFTEIFLAEIGIENNYLGKARDIARRFSRNFSQIFEFDAAYRWRVQDILSETTPEKIITQLELKRLAALIRERDISRIADQSQKLITLVRIAILLPWIRKALIKSLKAIDFTKLQLDDSDRYWCCFRADYKFFGLSNEDRMQMIRDKGWKVPPAYELPKTVV